VADQPDGNWLDLLSFLEPPYQHPESSDARSRTTRVHAADQTPQQTPGQSALSAWITKRYEVLRRNRWAEELKWYEAGLFDQQKQWLQKDGQDGRKLKPIKVNDQTTMPMPVSNYFSDTISINSNSLGAALPRMLAESDNQDNKNLRAAQAARNAIDAANEELG
jgi:phenylpropionate dioxygenase-like ring-hydroxylating dioxygenase large terminal subunit